MFTGCINDEMTPLSDEHKPLEFIMNIILKTLENGHPESTSKLFIVATIFCK